MGGKDCAQGFELMLLTLVTTYVEMALALGKEER